MAEANTFQLAQAVGGARITVPSGARLPLTAAQVARATLVQQGVDLIIVQADGPALQVRGYFSGAAPRDLLLADGSALSRETIEAGIGLVPTLPAVPPPGPPTLGRGAARGGDASLRSLTGSALDSLLGDQQDDGRFDRGPGGRSELPPLTILTAALGTGPASFSGGSTPRIPTELVASTAQQGAAGTTGGTTTTTGTTGTTGTGGTGTGTGGTGGGGGGGTLSSPTPSFARAAFAQDAGNPGDSSPALTGFIAAQGQAGTAGNDTYNGTTNTYTTTTATLNGGTGFFEFTIDDNNGAQQFNNSSPTFTYNGVTFNVGTATSTFADNWNTRPVNDTFAGLAGNDSISGGSLAFGSGQDLLLGDFDLPASYGRLTSSTADDGPGTAGDDTLVGGSGADTLYGGGGADSLMGGRDDDLLIVSDLNFVLADGGFGGDSTGGFPSSALGAFPTAPANVTRPFDTLRIAASDLTIDLGQNSLSTKIQNIEAIDLSTNGRNTFKATAAQIDSITNEDTDSNGTNGPDASTAADDKTDTLFVTGDATDSAQLTGGGWSKVGTAIAGNTLEINTGATTTFDKYTNTGGSDGVNDTVTVYVQTTVGVTLS